MSDSDICHMGIKTEETKLLGLDFSQAWCLKHDKPGGECTQLFILEAKYNRLLEFLKEIASLDNLPRGITCQHILNRSRDILKEIGELK